MSTVDRVQRSVMDQMLRGEVVPGSWVRQDELASQMGVSKIPVREAMQRLAALGLLRFEPNRGAVVPELSGADADENYTLRRSIEPELLRRAIPNMTVVDLAEAQRALDAPSGGPSGVAANWSFHRALYAPSQWRRGVAMVEILHASVAPYVVLYTEDLGGRTDSDDEHVELLEACRSGHVDQAVELLDSHLEHAARVLKHSFDKDVCDE